MIGICALLSAITHLLFFLYGEVHDRISIVKYTDVDYFVVTDAAKLVANGRSPYDRSTYRYTPLLSWMLYPAIHWYDGCGKLMFCLCDVLVGYLIYKIIRWQNISQTKSLYCASAWFFNPMAIIVSSRGNFESVVACMVLATTLSVLRKKSRWSGLLYGLSVHFKIYPVIYLFSFYIAIDLQYTKALKHNSLWQRLRLLIWPSKKRLIFAIFSVLGFAIPTCLSWLIYGNQYVEESFLYHLKRRDLKHNFSPYFYLLYLNSNQHGLLLSLVSFLPQIVLVVTFVSKFYRPVDLPFCLFLQTYAFVTFNKVCTSQYFLWFLSLLPLIIPRLKCSLKNLFSVLCLWIASQGVWLYAAYALEFHGRDTFIYLWLASLVFFISNVLAMNFFIVSYV